MSSLLSVSAHSFRYPTTEELKAYTGQLEDLRQEANNLHTQVAAVRYAFSSLQQQKKERSDIGKWS